MRQQIVQGVALVALGCSIAMGGCSREKPEGTNDERPVDTGTLTLPLVAKSASGKVYRLRQGRLPVFPFADDPFPAGGGGFVPGFDGGGTSNSTGGLFGAGGGFSVPGDGGPVEGGIGGMAFDGGVAGGGTIEGGIGGMASAGGRPGNTGGMGPGSSEVVLDTEENPDSSVLQAFLTPGGYAIQLLDGWFIEQVDELRGTATPVEAELLSSDFQTFGISSNGETLITFEFAVDGRRVVFGRDGRLIVDIEVHERNPGGNVCGNGFVDPGEDCDGFDTNGETCGTLTLNTRPFGPLLCTPTCEFDLRFCSPAFDDAGVSAGGSVSLPDGAPFFPVDGGGFFPSDSAAAPSSDGGEVDPDAEGNAGGGAAE